MNSKVKIISGKYKGHVGILKSIDVDNASYFVELIDKSEIIRISQFAVILYNSKINLGENGHSSFSDSKNNVKNEYSFIRYKEPKKEFDDEEKFSKRYSKHESNNLKEDYKIRRSTDESKRYDSRISKSGYERINYEKSDSRNKSQYSKSRKHDDNDDYYRSSDSKKNHKHRKEDRR